MLRAFLELSKKGVVHRDLKPENILANILPNSVIQLKLADFGTSRYLPAVSAEDRTDEGVFSITSV